MPSKVARYWVSDETDIRCSRPRPGAPASTTNKSMWSSPPPVRASTTNRSAAAANCTWSFEPSSTKPSPSERAASCTPRGPYPPPGSSQPTDAMVEPDAMPASRSDRWAGVPASAIAPADSTQLTKWGSGASERPSSS